MQIIDLADFSPRATVPTGAVLILGYFDGVHLGHRALFREANDLAKGLGDVKKCVWTFDIMPKAGDRALTTTHEKCRLIADCGADYVILEDFDSLKHLDGEDFFRIHIAEKLIPAAVVCGFNFTFGKGASRTAGDLAKLAGEFGIPCTVVGEQRLDGSTVSSSRIRQLIENGHTKEANSLLGHPYAITCPIEHGVQIGRQMGVRTINQRLPLGKVCPKRGVYCCTVTFDAGGYPTTYGGVCNIGYRPTVNDDQNDVTIETHIFGFDGEIYGEQVTTSIYAMLREERKFPDLDALMSQIKEDSARAEEMLKEILK